MVIKDALSTGKTILKNADIESFLADSLILLCFALKITKERYIIIKDNEISKEAFREYMSLIEKRVLKYPVKYLTGKAEFMGIDFMVEPGILIPRPETELLVEKAISLSPVDIKVNIADLCCGSGCIGISTAFYLKNSFVSLFDISDTALKVSENNAKANNIKDRVKVMKKDILTEGLEGQFDMILSNPPYIPTEEYNSLMEDVRLYEPEIALHSPGDDLKFYKRIVSNYTKNLKEKGYLLFEVGYNQADSVKEIISVSGMYSEIEIIKDYSGIERIVCARKTISY